MLVSVSHGGLLHGTKEFLLVLGLSGYLSWLWRCVIAGVDSHELRVECQVCLVLVGSHESVVRLQLVEGSQVQQVVTGGEGVRLKGSDESNMIK